MTVILNLFSIGTPSVLCLVHSERVNEHLRRSVADNFKGACKQPKGVGIALSAELLRWRPVLKNQTLI